MKLQNRMLLEQKQILSLKQIQSLELLSFNNTDLDAFLRNENMENPLLENTRTGTVPGGVDDFQQWYNSEESNDTDIHEYIWDQLQQDHYDAMEKKAIDFMINCLDNNGFFDIPLDEIVRLTGVCPEIIKKCLQQLRQLEPYGIFARNLSDCLIRQLDVMGVNDNNLTKILKNYLDDLSKGNIAKITRELKISSTVVRKYNEFIVNLNPRPISAFYIEKPIYIIPDIIVSNKDNSYEIILNDDWFGDYQLNDYYSKLMSETKDPELLEYFSEKKKRVLFILKAIKQRRKTLMEITETIIILQGDKLGKRDELKPMTMKQVAEKMGVNVSTVSRAVKDKYIQYPKGVMLIKDLFSTPVSIGTQSNMNALQIKKEIKLIIENEDMNKPYSDAKISKLLQEKDIVLSRRGVAKYRDEMLIKGSFERKR